MNLSKLQLAKIGLERGAISQQEYNSIINSLKSPKKSYSKMELLELGKKQGAISDEEYNNLKAKFESDNIDNLPNINIDELPKEPIYKRGESSFDITPEQIDKFDKRREQSLKRLEGLPRPIATAVEYLYPKGEQMAQEAQSAAKGARNIATLPGAVADLPMLPLNLGFLAAGQQTYVPSQMIGQAIDTATGNYTKPTTSGENIKEAVTQSVLPMGIISKGAGFIAQNAPKFVKPLANFLKSSNVMTPTNVGATAASSAAVQHYINENPDASLAGTLPIGILAGIAGGKVGKNIGYGINPKQTLAHSLSINPEKVKAQLSSSKFPDKYNTSTLADISDSDRIHMFQHLLSKTPFIGRPIEIARNAAINAENAILQNQVLKNALSPASTGELAAKGARNIKNLAKSKQSKGYNEIFEDIKPHGIIDEDAHHVVNPKSQKTIKFFTNKSASHLAQEPVNIVPLESSKKYTGEILSQLEIPLAQEDKLNTLLGNIAKKLENYAEIYHGKGIPIKTLNDTRKQVDKLVKTWDQTGDITQQQLKGLSGTINEDIGNYLQSIDPKSKYKWDKINKFASHHIEHERPIIDSIINKEKKLKLTEISNDLVNNAKDTGKTISLVSRGLDKNERSLLGYSIFNQLGLDKEQNFDIFKVSKQYRELKPNGKNALNKLFTHEDAKNIQRMSKRMRHIQEAISYQSKSPTGFFNAMWKIIRSPVTTLPALAANGLAVKLYASPKFLNWLGKGAIMNDKTQFMKHVDKLKTMNLGDKILNQGVRSLHNQLVKEEKKEEE